MESEDRWEPTRAEVNVVARLVRGRRKLPHQEVDDVVQDVMTALSARDKLEVTALFVSMRDKTVGQPLLNTIIRNKIADYYRSKSHNVPTVELGERLFDLNDGKDSVLTLLIDQDELVRLFRAIKVLTPRQQKIIELMASGKSNEEIARDLDIPESTVRGNWMRARKKIHYELQHKSSSAARGGGRYL